MLEAFEVLNDKSSGVELELILTFDERKKSRYLATTTCGQELGWFIERGAVLSHGDILKCKNGTLVKILAAEEDVSEVSSDDFHLLMRVAYHLGNRHVPLQVEKSFLRYQQDHVLDEMVRGLGAEISHENQPFNPESGAYAGGNQHSH